MGGRREHPAVQGDVLDPQLAERDVRDGHEERVQRGEEYRDRQIPDAVDVIDPARVLAGLLGRLDHPRAAQAGKAEQHELVIRERRGDRGDGDGS